MGAWLPGLATYPFSVVNNRHPLLLCVSPTRTLPVIGKWNARAPSKSGFSVVRGMVGLVGWFGLAVARVPTLTPLARREETSSVKRGCTNARILRGGLTKLHA